MGGGYFRGLVVGVVSKVEQRQGDATRTIVVSPNASFSNVNEVLVVLGMGGEAAASSDANAANTVVNAVSPSALSSSSAQSSSSDSNASTGNSSNGGE